MAWFDELPETITYDNNGAPAPLRDHPFVKESPDLGHFVNKAFQSHSEVGRRIPLRITNDAEKEQWRKEHLPKLWDSGVIPRPPSDPKEYGIVKPEKFPEGLNWNEERAGKLATTLHKYGVPKEAAAELMQLHEEAVVESQEYFKTNYDDAIAALKREHGDKYDERYEDASRLVKSIFKPEELTLLEQTGLANHPAFLSLLMKLAPLAKEDSSVIPEANRGGSGKMNPDQLRAEIADIMSNPQNPRHKLYMLGDKATQDYIDGLYRSVYGDGKVVIS